MSSPAACSATPGLKVAGELSKMTRVRQLKEREWTCRGRALDALEEGNLSVPILQAGFPATAIMPSMSARRWLRGLAASCGPAGRGPLRRTMRARALVLVIYTALRPRCGFVRRTLRFDMDEGVLLR